MKKVFYLWIFLIGLNSCTPFGSIDLQPGFTIYVNDTNSIPIKNALSILQRDITNVLGEKAHIVSDLKNLKDADNALIIINEDTSGLPLIKLKGFEQHKIYSYEGNLVLHGADLRGTIYAILTFSEKFLGIKPLWFWSSSQPQTKENISIPRTYSFDSREPYVKYRSWFPNDTDLFSPWRKESPVNNEIWLETMLRLKLNTIETGSSTNYSKIYAVSDDTKLINRYGLKITYHHISALNAPYKNWNKYWTQIKNMEAPELLLSNTAQIEEFWRYNVKCLVKNGIDPLWVINFRGDRDIPFWHTFKDAPESLKERAKVINDMVNRQVQILKEETKNESPNVRMIFYNELSDMLSEGLLIPPKEKNLIWNFVAARRDHVPNEDIRSIHIPDSVKLGYYMNLQFNSTGSHLVQAEGPWKMEKNFRFVDSKNNESLYFSVVNAGNLREHLLTLSANADMLWNFDSYDSDKFVKDFCANYYGNEHAELIAGLYKDFFYSYWNQKNNDLHEYERQYIFYDLRYKLSILQLSKIFDEPVDLNPLKDFSSEQMSNRTFRIDPENNNAKNQIEAIINGTRDSYESFRRVAFASDSILGLIKPESRVFFNDNLRYMSNFMMYLNESLHKYCLAYISKSETDRLDYLKESLIAAMNARDSIYKTAHDDFELWYSNERIFNMDDIISRIDKTLKKQNNRLSNSTKK